MSDAVRVRLPWRRPPLTLNDRPRHWATGARLKREMRTEAAWAIRADDDAMRLRDAMAGRRLSVQLGYTPRDRRRRDTDNLAPVLKALSDACVDVGLVPDDVPEHVARPEPIITNPSCTDPHLWVELSITDPYRPEESR